MIFLNLTIYIHLHVHIIICLIITFYLVVLLIIEHHCYFLTIYPAFIVMPYFNVMLKSRQDFEAGPRHWSIWACQAGHQPGPASDIKRLPPRLKFLIDLFKTK